jgi:hypothetical protein
MHRYTQTASEKREKRKEKREKRKEKREKNYSGREIKTTPSETTKEAEASFVFFALVDD